VTNVSHDLKTPLTSIISYIDLLSAEELSPTARDYVTIIEDKSQRLKTMVADLFDLAKATSRTDVQSEEIDAVVLTRQVLGDMADKIEASGRALKCDIQAETAPINADGKKMYRVLQNIIDNALKYSMEGTRIYLTLKNENGACDIIIKNIASYEMTFNPDEITERFTRGDEARSTEGNGLGLSIAKSFTEACGGQFRVDIDGDMFIAVVTIPVI
jgi:signal transduction histidine kinase